MDGVADELARGDNDGEQGEQEYGPYMVEAVNPVVVAGSLKFLQRRDAANY